MKCEVEEIDSCNRKLTIEIPLADYNAEVKSYYQKLSREVKVPGFRPGKVPVSIMEKRFGPEVKREVLTQMVSSSISTGIQENKLKAVGDPSIVEIQAEEGTDISVTANVEVLPEFTLKECGELAVEMQVAKVTDEDVDKVIDSLREQKAQSVPVLDRPAQKGDLAKLDFESTLNGAPYKDGAAKDYVIQLGADHLIKGFDENILGMGIGEERSFDLTLPKDHSNKDVAGKEMGFKVTLKGLQIKVPPELDDEFAKTVDPTKGYQTVEDLKAGVRKELEDYERKQARKNSHKKLAEALAEANTIDIPEKLIQEQIQFMANKEKQSADAAGHIHEPPPGEAAPAPAEAEGRHRESAVKLLQQELVINQLAEDLSVEVSEQELEQELRGFMSLLGVQDLKKIKQEWTQSGALLRLHNRMRREKTLEQLLDKVQIKEEMVDRGAIKTDNINQ